VVFMKLEILKILSNSITTRYDLREGFHDNLLLTPSNKEAS
jgi:hypothetical protein